jgi:hypothetical protein
MFCGRLLLGIPNSPSNCRSTGGWVLGAYSYDCVCMVSESHEYIFSRILVIPPSFDSLCIGSRFDPSSHLDSQRCDPLGFSCPHASNRSFPGVRAGTRFRIFTVNSMVDFQRMASNFLCNRPSCRQARASRPVGFLGCSARCACALGFPSVISRLVGCLPPWRRACPCTSLFAFVSGLAWLGYRYPVSFPAFFLLENRSDTHPLSSRLVCASRC